MLYTSPATHRGKGLRDMKVSIIITSYNYEQYIGETLKSIQAQTHRDWEAIVVDDGSTDNSVAIIRRFAEEDPRIHFYRHEGGMNKGIIATNLLALSKCTAELVAFCESDDVLLPESIERRAELMERYPEVVCCFSDITYTNDRLEPIIDRMPRRLPVNRPFDIRFLHTLGYEVHTFSCAMVRKAALEQCDFAELGYSHARVEQARYLMLGGGVKADPAAALKILQEVCLSDMKAPHLFNYMGCLYLTGVDGQGPDDDMALQCFRYGEHFGDADAVNNLGVMYEDGIGVEENTEQALRYYRRAAELGSKEASANLVRLTEEAAKGPLGTRTQQQIINGTTRVIEALPVSRHRKDRWLKHITPPPTE